MTNTKENNQNPMYYACCPMCKCTLIQAENGLNGYIKCGKCGNVIQIIIKKDRVMTWAKLQ